MANKTLRLIILTPAETLLDIDTVSWIQAPLAGGESIGIYPGHAPLLAETRQAPLRYATSEGEQHTATLEAGILHIDNTGQVVILTAGTAETTQGESAEEHPLNRLIESLIGPNSKRKRLFKGRSSRPWED